MSKFSDWLRQLLCAMRPAKTTIVPPAEPDDPRAARRYVVVDLEWNQYPKWVRTPISREGVVM
ncbi:MAG: hypothetical protein LBN04_09835, partial [Oscillospiraceae bacterium]|nr:hypothetical protein [Oscillospiraceae bacterium]